MTITAVETDKMVSLLTDSLWLALWATLGLVGITALALGVLVLGSALLDQYRLKHMGDPSDPTENKRRQKFARKMRRLNHVEAKALSATATGEFSDGRTARAYASYRAATPSERDHDAFLSSLAITYFSTSPFFGLLLGGSVGGALAGWLLLPPKDDGSRRSDSATSELQRTSCDAAAPSAGNAFSVSAMGNDGCAPSSFDWPSSSDGASSAGASE